MSITYIGLPNLIEQYTLLIKNREGFNDLKKIDKKTTSTLSKIVKIGAQDRRIADIQSLIDATKEKGLIRKDVRNLRSIKSEVKDLASKLLMQGQEGSAKEAEDHVVKPFKRKRQKQSSSSSSVSVPESEVTTSEIDVNHSPKQKEPKTTLELINRIDEVVSNSLPDVKNKETPSAKKARKHVVIKSTFQFLPKPIRNAASTIASLFSSLYYFFKPTNHIDTTFEVLR